MLAGWGNIRRLKTLVERAACHLIQNASKDGVKIDNRRSLLIITREIKTSTSSWLGSRSRPHSAVQDLRLWQLLRRLGVSRCKIHKIKSFLLRLSYPWLSYAVPAALIFAAGDLIAQIYFNPIPRDISYYTFLDSCWNKERTIAYFLKGLLMVGPILSWWNLFWFRKLRCKKMLTYILVKTFLDVFVLAPLLVSLMAIIYDQTLGAKNLLNTSWEDIKKLLECKYVPAIKEVLSLNAIARPLMVMILCYMAPPHLRRSLRGLYEVVFVAFLSHTFAKYRLGASTPLAQNCPVPPQPPTTPACEDFMSDKKYDKKRKWGRLAKIWNWPC